MAKALVEAMGSQADVLNAAVRQVLASHVDPSTGKPPQYSSSPKVPFCEYMIGRAMREAATEAISSAVAAYKDQIKAEVMRQLGNSKSKFAKRLAEAMASEFEGAAQAHRIVVNLDYEVKPSNGY